MRLLSAAVLAACLAGCKYETSSSSRKPRSIHLSRTSPKET